MRFEEEDVPYSHKHSRRRTGGSSGEAMVHCLPTGILTPDWLGHRGQLLSSNKHRAIYLPLSGEHSREVLGELGYEKSDVDRLLAQQIILETTDG